ncbi:hypothetical protein LF1_17040 [Rubripirellula obstinata]|uniref:Uncharacterized protein n=1 Tax=Rubripirellula obstinata TaxID=406547 RepID=A0A5B1CGW7_9BACT|nr:hypothetical protein LF1_17040 [Rubripirellula obstinata]
MWRSFVFERTVFFGRFFFGCFELLFQFADPTLHFVRADCFGRDHFVQLIKEPLKMSEADFQFGDSLSLLVVH